MKYHPEILYAKYHFVCRVGRHFKNKKQICLEIVKNRPKSGKCAPSMVLSALWHGNACRINEELVLVFKFYGDLVYKFKNII